MLRNFHYKPLINNKLSMLRRTLLDFLKEECFWSFKTKDLAAGFWLSL